MAAIANLLDQTIGALKEFLAAVADERHCLVKGDTSQLLAIAEKKSALATRLSDLDTRRDAALGAAGLGIGRAGVEAWIAARPVGMRPAAHKSWQIYMDLATEARDENELNGKLIAAHLQQNQQALEALLGSSAAGGTYGADGQRSMAASRRPLGSA
ncbi:MAG: flagellar protein FlgN [Sterolibacteriaceae bacterium]|nr:flagellar protein FlgN [Sterolibacteriaceae bacterium]